MTFFFSFQNNRPKINLMVALLRMILQLYIYVIIIDVVLSYVPNVRSQKWAQSIHKLANVTEKPIREMLPAGMPLDPSPIIVILLVQMLMYLLS